MKTIIFLVFALTFSSMKSQTDWIMLYNNLLLKKEKSQITYKEFELDKFKLAGLIEFYCVKNLKIEKCNFPKGSEILELRFVTDSITNISTYPIIQMCLRNGLKTVKTVQAGEESSMDGTQEYFFINDRWIKGNKHWLPPCGQTLPTQDINPNECLFFDLPMKSFLSGDKKIKFKFSILVDKDEVFSNVIEINLFEIQIKHLLEDAKGTTP